MTGYVISPADPPLRVVVDPTHRDGWSYTGLVIVDLGQGGSVAVRLDGQEAVVVPLVGCGEVRAGGGMPYRLERSNVFRETPSAVYVPAGSPLSISGEGRFAVATATVSEAGRFEVAEIPATQVTTVSRGAGQMSRLVRNIAMPGTFDACEAILVCEVVTPGGNWSSYPAHKHDEHTVHERPLEEIYYYEIANGPSGTPGIGFHQTSSTDPQRPIDVLVEVRTGDTVLVPYGWHGPAAAAPGHDMYYLNVMAGPVGDRAWLISDHPDQAWVRGLWEGQPVDPRVEELL